MSLAGLSLAGLLLAGLLLAGVLGCGGGVEAETLKVVLSYPQGGMGISMRHGAELAFEQWRETASRPVVVDYHETLVIGGEGTWEQAMVLEEESAHRAAEDPRVMAYIGPSMSEQAKVSLPILNRAGITQVSTTATWPGLTEAGFAPGEPGIYYPTGQPHFFRLVPHDGQQAVAAARWCAQQGFQRIFLVHSSGLFSMGYAGIFAESLSDANLELVGRHSWSSHRGTAADVEALVAEVQKLSPDAVYLVDNSGWLTSELVRQLGERLPDMPVMAPDYLMRLAYRGKLSATRGQRLFSTSPLPPEKLRWSTPEGQHFYRSYLQRFGVEPDAESAKSYEAMRLVLAAIEAAERPTREAVQQALRELPPSSGVLGRIAFDAAGDLLQARIFGYRYAEEAWHHEVTL